MIVGKGILKRLLSSEIKVDMLVLFHRNPGLIDSMDGVARRIGRTADRIETDVKDLVDLGVLRTKQIGKSEVILFDRAKDEEIQGIVADHIKSLTTGKGI